MQTLAQPQRRLSVSRIVVIRATTVLPRRRKTALSPLRPMLRNRWMSANHGVANSAYHSDLMEHPRGEFSQSKVGNGTGGQNHRLLLFDGSRPCSFPKLLASQN